MIPPFAQALSLRSATAFRYSICTLVTQWDEYRAMAESFVRAGFDPAFCEYLYIDNSAGTQADGFQGCNAFLALAQGEYIILCHQDILLHEDRREQLEICLRELDQRDPTWALLGNAGGTSAGEIAIRITDPSGSHDSGNLPAQVRSLDENFLLARRSARLAVSHDLAGFHLFGTDLCQVARALGRTAWVVNFHLRHKSSGRRDEQFLRLRRETVDKYRRIYRSEILQTPSTALPFAASAWANDHAHFTLARALEKTCRRQGGGTELQRNLLKAYALGRPTYALHWLYHRLTQPFANLRRSLAKRLPQSGRR